MNEPMIEPRLGQYIRAGRLGWHWSERLGAFLRVSDAAPDRWLFDARPADHLPKRPDGMMYRVWWPSDREAVEDVARRVLFAELRGGFVRRPVQFIVGEQGELVFTKEATE